MCFLTFNNDKSIEISIKIRKFQNVFSFKIATILFFYNDQNYAIDLIFEFFFYELLYNTRNAREFFNKKFIEFEN